MATMADPQHIMKTSGETDPVWIHTEPYSNRPQFSKLGQDLNTDVCIIGASISGISTAYELVKRGVDVVMLEARQVLSGETGRTSGHLASDLDDGYIEIAKKHGDDGAKMAADSHDWALQHVGDVAKELGIDCEYRMLNGYDVSQFPKPDPKHEDDIKEIKEDMEKAKDMGLEAHYEEGGVVPGWDGAVDQRDIFVYGRQATFHPTKYLNGLLRWLQKQPNFQCYEHTRVMEINERGVELLGFGNKDVQLKTEAGNTVTCKDAVEATCIPLQKLSVIAQEEYYRTYCIAIRVPKGSVEDCLIYDSADPYIYVRITACDEKDDYMVIGGKDHKVGQEDPSGRFEELGQWTRDRFTHVGAVDYKWSGQIFEPIDHMAFIGRNQGNKHTYIITGDSGNGLTHGVLAGRLLADEIQGVENPWAKLYDPTRIGSMLKQLPDMVSHDVQINAQYKRFLQSDLQDIEDLAPGSGGVLNPKTKKPIAVFKDESGKVHKLNALCPHLKGVLCWNGVEKSWDCPIHGSRFSKEGIQLIGPAKGNMEAYGEGTVGMQEKTKAG